MFLNAKYSNFTSIMPYKKIPISRIIMFFKQKETKKPNSKWHMVIFVPSWMMIDMTLSLHGSTCERKLRTTAVAWRNFTHQCLTPL